MNLRCNILLQQKVCMSWLFFLLQHRPVNSCFIRKQSDVHILWLINETTTNRQQKNFHHLIMGRVVSLSLFFSFFASFFSFSRVCVCATYTKLYFKMRVLGQAKEMHSRIRVQTSTRNLVSSFKGQSHTELNLSTYYT